MPKVSKPVNVPPTATPMVTRFVNIPAVFVPLPTAGVGTNIEGEEELGARLEVEVELGGGRVLNGVTARFVILK